MKDKRKILRRVLTLALCFAVILPATLSIWGDKNTAQALTSLPYIETIKSSSKTFHILEIVPTFGEGSLGYYIDGQEPCADWATDAEKSIYATDPTTRASKINARFDALEAAGILGTGDTTPLEHVSDYSEVYPWLQHEGYTKLTLDHTEKSESVPGTFTPASNGAYTQSKDFVYASGGDYVQIIDYFAKTDEPLQPGEYYYVPTFAQVSGTVQNGTAVYDNNYVYYGTVGAVDYKGMEIGQPYYYVTSYSEPFTTKPITVDGSIIDDSKIYMGISDAYRIKNSGETGYFNIDPTMLIYTYVGTGGTYNFNYNQNSTNFNKIECDTIYYKSGYKNNNWFLRHIFDWTQGTDSMPAVKLKVTTVAGNTATVSQINQADLIVLSNGFEPGGTATAYSSSNDITPAVSQAITDAIQKTGSTDEIFNMPIIVDNRLLSSSATNLRTLATTLKNSSSFNTFVSGSVFFFAPDATRTELATRNFCTMYNSSNYAVSGSAFYPAYEVIVYENFIRQQQNSSAVPLEEKVNLSRAIRYIVNYANQRVKGLKTKISVLEIEPSDQNLLTKTTIAGWTGYDEADITVDYMSMLEFVGKNDDLIESYDIIYVGDNGGAAVDKLDTGYMYENIGAPVSIRNDAAGLTDSEYSNTVFTTAEGKSYYALQTSTNMPKTRYSGNDLSTKKLDDLNVYAVSGHPVIIAGGLTSGYVSGDTEAVTFQANITSTANGTGAHFSASPEAISGVLPASTPTYQWYRNGYLISGATSSTYDTTTTGNYYCKITYSFSGTSYTATSDTISYTVTDEHTEITNDDSTKQTGTFNGQVSKNLTVDISTTTGDFSGTTTNVNTTAKFVFNVTPAYESLPSGAYIQYTWYRQRYRVSNNKTYGAATSVLTTTSTTPRVPIVGFSSNSYYDRYYCIAKVYNSSGIVISTSNATSNTNYKVTRRNSSSSQITISDSGGSAAVSGAYPLTVPLTFTPYVTPTSGIADDPQYLYAYPNISGYTASYRWYVDDGFELWGSSYYYYIYSDLWDIGESHTYYCRVTINSVAAITNTITLTRKGPSASFQNTGGGASGSIPAQTAQNFSISSGKVDNCSNMYSFLNGNKSRNNVMRSTDINSDTLLRYLNLSKPSITLTSQPTAYSWSGNSGDTPTGLIVNPDGTFTLNYAFAISNATDTTPLDTRYYCNLYIDQDNDSRFISQERIGSMTITETSTGLPVTSGALKADTSYNVTYRVPADRVGYIYWKLQVVKVNEETVHASQTGNTYIKPAAGKAETLNILQINTGRTSSQTCGFGGAPYGGLPLDTTTGTVPTSITSNSSNSSTQRQNIANSWTTIYKYLQNISSDYKINIQTITTTQANNIASTAIINKLDKDNSEHYTNKSYTNIKDFLDSYDMLIIGFDDAYNEMSRNTSVAIVNYLNDGHPILYTHDTTSLPNVPEVYATKSGSNSKFYSDKAYYFGYYFNSVLRDPLGLDRYGVTNSTYGGTAKSNPFISMSGLVAAGYSGLTPAIKQDIKNAGYGIVYSPGTNTSGTGGTPIGTTQGLTNYTYVVSGDGNLESNAVSQINKGQITTYPYDVNLSGRNTMSILTTHQQYYQANMNPDDVMVWYCMSGTGYQYNDAANGYYIFSNGNATYSGLGHSVERIGDNEAKLFVNSIIAAYRITAYAPEIKFTDYRGTNSLNTFLVPYDNGVLEPSTTPDAASTDTSRKIYFTVTDTNIGKNKLVSAVVSLSNGTDPKDGTNYYLNNKLTVPIYDSLTNKAVDADESLVSGLAYYVRLDDILGKVSLDDKESVSIYVVAKTTVHGNDYLGTKLVTLRRQELFSLS